ncbi:hypothetical protein [Nocardia terrae]|uniref:hypothetical protein n=1 Tax=Nocardia terrae TaxID=2675851 RepID=UPI0018DFB6F4|nr:hypothetical protein [Nocardia terrae]
MEREPTVNEREALYAMLEGDFPGAAELREQALTVKVIGKCACGCPAIDLLVDPTTPAAPNRPNPAREAATDDGGLLLFVQDGKLTGLEYYSWTDDTPEHFPPPGRIHRTS